MESKDLIEHLGCTQCGNGEQTGKESEDPACNRCGARGMVGYGPVNWEDLDNIRN